MPVDESPAAHRRATAPTFSRRHFTSLAAAMLVELSLPREGSAQQPRFSGAPAAFAPVFPLTRPAEDSFAALMAYNPAADPDASFFRSTVPRAARIAAFAPTQAHPRLRAEPQLGSLTGCYRSLGQEPENRYKRMRYGMPPADGVYVSRMIGCHDILVNWSGPGVIPNPAMTDAAHRSGARSLGTIFQPDRRIYDSSAAPAAEVSAKFVDLALYFGFDGYFMNFENGTPQGHAQVLALLAAMRREARRRGKRDFYVQFYDGSSAMDGLMPLRPGGAEPGGAQSYANSAMLDQGWSGYNLTHGCCSGEPLDPQTVSRYCIEHGLDPFASAFFGFQLYPGPGYFGLSAPAVIAPNTGSPAYGSLQIYSTEDGLCGMIGAGVAQEPLDLHDSPLSDRQEQFYALERLFFSGRSGNPALDNAPETEEAALYAQTAGGTRRYTDHAAGPLQTTDQMRLPITYGVATFITERSVIGALPFVARFNLGEGDAFWIDGEQVSSTPWFNLGVQDLLPTWQWRQTPMDRPLDPGMRAYAPLAVSYDKATAWDGGSSLRVQGTPPEGGTALHLYKTKLRIPAGGDAPVLQLVWQGGAAERAQCRLGMVFEDAPAAPVWIRLADTARVEEQPLPNGWTRSVVPLAAYQGRTIAALLLGFGRMASGDAAANPITLHVGEIYIGTRTSAARQPAPSGFRIEAWAAGAAAGSIQARLRWESDRGAAFYDVFCAPAGSASRRWLGRIASDRYYAAAIPALAPGPIIFELEAVGRRTPLLRSGASRAVLERPV